MGKSNIKIKEFYKNQTGKTPLLLTKAGKVYKSLFEAVKIRYLLYGVTKMQTVENDNIFPKDWIQSAYKEFWQYSMKLRLSEELG